MDINSDLNGANTAADTCDIPFVNERSVRAALGAMPDDGVVLALAETFKVMADPTRLRIIAALAMQELCVCDLARILDVTGSAVSHQLRLLRGQRLVIYRKEGKIAYYTLDDEHIEALFAEALNHVTER